MKNEKILELKTTLTSKINKVSDIITEAKSKSNYGKATLYTGRKEAYEEILDLLNNRLTSYTR